MLGSMLLQGSAMAPSAACQGRLARQSTVVQGTVLHPACLHRCPAPGRRRRHRACYAAAIPAGAASAQAEMHQELREAAAAGAQQHNGATTAAEVEQAIQREPEPSAQFDWNKQWYPISWMKDLDPATPNPLQLLGKNLVAWNDPAGQWNVFLDVCPHRLVPLSEGRVNEDGRLECPYHGWAFSAGGRCDAIPQGGNPAAPRSAATAYPCAVKQGLLWVWPSPGDLAHLNDGPDEANIPLLPEAEPGNDIGWDPEVTVNTFRDFPYDYATLVENLADPGHVPFTHHATVSKRSTSSVIDLEVTRRGPDGFDGRWVAGPRQGTMGQMDTQLRFPTLLRHTIDAYDAKGFANITATYCVPLAPGRSRVFVRQPFRFRSKLPAVFMKLVPDWSVHTGQNKVLEDDVIFLHAQESESVERGLGDAPIGKVYHMPGASDAYVTAFRSWLQRSAGGGPFGPQDQKWLQAAGPRQPREELLDRYHSHTKHCKACSGALRNTRRGIAVTSVAAPVLALASAVAVAAALSGGLAAAQAAAASAVSSGGFLSRLGGRLLQGICAALPASGSAAGCMVAAAGLLLAAVAVAVGQQRLRKLEASFITGTWPPPRNA